MGMRSNTHTHTHIRSDSTKYVIVAATSPPDRVSAAMQALGILGFGDLGVPTSAPTRCTYTGFRVSAPGVTVPGFQGPLAD